MSQTVKRPRMTHGPGQGVLRAEHCQVAYVTNDGARARAVFKERYGVRAFAGLDSAPAGGGSIHIDLAWVGETMFELIEANGPGTEFYTSRLPAAGFAIRHHHLGYFVHDLTAWEALQAEIRRGGWPVVFEGRREGFLRFCYIEAPELGHYLEYILPEEAGVSFFESVPAS